MEALVIVITVLSCLMLIALIIVCVVLFGAKNKNNEKSNNEVIEIAKISQQLSDLPTRMKADIQISLANEMVKANEAELKKNELQNEKLERFQMNITKSINDRFDSMNKQLETKIIELNKKVDDKLKEGFSTTSETMAQVRERLQAIDTAQQNIQSLSKDVVSLKTVLEGNQTRGRYGEYQLKFILQQVFGDVTGGFEEQYYLRGKGVNSVRADAVVFMPEPNKMICIDSKFPFANYKPIFEANTDEEKENCKHLLSRDVKKHITDIKTKYIIPNKTAPEAIMFIPNDGVFAMIHNELYEVVEYARSQGVIITSPSTLPPILVTINMLKIEGERAKNVSVISQQIKELGKQFSSFATDWSKFSKQLETATRSREVLDKRVYSLTNNFDNISTNESLKEISFKEDEEI